MATDDPTVNDTTEPAAMRMPILDDNSSLFAGVTAWCRLYVLQGCWQVPSNEDGQEMLTMVTPEGLLTPRRFPLGWFTLHRIFLGDNEWFLGAVHRLDMLGVGGRHGDLVGDT